MVKLDHLTLRVRDCIASRDWYVRHLGLKVEFEVGEPRAFALQDDAGFTVFVEQSTTGSPSAGCALYFQVENVEAFHARLARVGTTFAHPPQPTYWGYGAEFADPDGHRIRLWDEVTMREKSGIAGGEAARG